MRKLRSMLLATASAIYLSLFASRPIEYVTMVRDNDGKVLTDTEMQFEIDVLDSPTSTSPIYTERHSARSDASGYVTLWIGEGEADPGAFDRLKWTEPRYLRVSVDAAGYGMRTLGTMQFAAVPRVKEAAKADAMERRSPMGDLWSLRVDDEGNLSWFMIEGNHSGDPQYDQSKVPENLYFIGTFNNWKVAEAVPFRKLSDTRFTITRNLEKDEIFKFTPTQSWTNDYDWSAVTVNIGSVNKLKEFGNSPAFEGATGEYTITVDFYNFTMTIKKN